MLLVLVLVLVHYALPFSEVRLSSFAAAATALSIVSCACTAEIFRAGIEALPKGQFKAAAAIGLNFFDTLRDVVLPQALRIVTPIFTSNCVNVRKRDRVAQQKVADPGAKRSHSPRYGEYLQRRAGDLWGDKRA